MKCNNKNTNSPAEINLNIPEKKKHANSQTSGDGELLCGVSCKLSEVITISSLRNEPSTYIWQFDCLRTQLFEYMQKIFIVVIKKSFQTNGKKKVNSRMASPTLVGSESKISEV